MQKIQKIQKVATFQNWVFSFAISCFFFVLLPNGNAFSFEYKDYEKKIKNNYNIRNIIERMPRADLEKNLREFVANGRPNRLAGSIGHKKVQAYLESKLKSYSSPGVSVKKIEFDGLIEKKPQVGVNFIWEKKGISGAGDVIIFAANYDTLLKDPKTGRNILKGEMPGADNNASGVAIILSMIEILNKLDLPKTVRLILLDMGEFGQQGARNFAGSREFLLEKNSKKIVGVISLSMLGHDSRTGDKEKKLNNMNLYVGPDEIFGAHFIKGGKINYSNVTFTIIEAAEDLSAYRDSNIFRESGVSAITFSQNREGDLNPRYMTANDFIETLNLNTYSNVFKYITSALLVWNYDVAK